MQASALEARLAARESALREREDSSEAKVRTLLDLDLDHEDEDLDGGAAFGGALS